MSGTPSSPTRDRDVHIRAARDWLARADEQFASGEPVMAAATLMLAQAELKLLVERVASTVPAPAESRPSPSFRLLPFGRTLLGAGALAACLVVGVFLGRAMALSPGSAPAQIAGQAPAEIPAEPVQIPSTHPAETGPPEEKVSTPPEEETRLAEVPSEVSAAQSPPRRTVRRQPVHTVSPAAEAPEAVEEPKPETVAAPPPEDLQGSPEPVAEDGIAAAEVALRTIQALSQRLLMGEVE